MLSSTNVTCVGHRWAKKNLKMPCQEDNEKNFGKFKNKHTENDISLVCLLQRRWMIGDGNELDIC